MIFILKILIIKMNEFNDILDAVEDTMDMDCLSALLDSSLVSDPCEEYDKLLKSQQFSVEDLFSAHPKVISSTNVRYQRYIKYINFNDESFFIKAKINEYFVTENTLEKIILIKQIDKIILDFIDN